MTYERELFSFFFFSFLLSTTLLTANSVKVPASKKTKICEDKQSITGTVPYIIHNSQRRKERHTHTVPDTRASRNHLTYTHTHTYDNLYTLAELSFHIKKKRRKIG